jgi:hypothetical protein
MDPATLALISGGLQLGTGLLGAGQANARDKDAQQNLKNIQDLYAQLLVPSMEDQKLALQDYKSAGTLVNQQETPEQLAARDALQNVSLDPRLKQTQMNQLDTLQKIAGKGFTPDEKYALDEQRAKNEADVTAKLKQLQQQQSMKGVGNSDMALAQRMMEAQSGANRGAEDQRAIDAQGFKRSLDAISQAGNLAGNMDQTDYARQAQLAQNLNQRELTNMQQRTQAQKSNVDRFNHKIY